MATQMSNLILLSILSCYLSFIFILICSADKIRYVSPERPNIIYYSQKYISYLNMSSHRHSRNNPIYYFNLNFLSKYSLDNNVTVTFYVYEYSGTRYYRSYIDMHFKLCDLVHKDNLFGSALRQQAQLRRPCPFPAGEYNLMNMTLQQDAIPKAFPFRKGRLWCNATSTATKEVIISAYIDVEIREMKISKKN